MSIYGLAEPGWLQAVVSDCISDKFERLTHVLVIGPSIVQYFLKEDCRFSILYETIVFNEIAEWIYILGYKTFIDKKIAPSNHLYPYKFFTNEEFVANYFVELL